MLNVFSDMKQCPNCEDIALEEYDKGHWICGTCGWEVFEEEDMKDE